MKKYNLNLKKLVPDFHLDSRENPTEDEVVVIEKENLSAAKKEANIIFEKRKKENLAMLKTISQVIKAVKYNKILEAIDFFSLKEAVVPGSGD